LKYKTVFYNKDWIRFDWIGSKLDSVTVHTGNLQPCEIIQQFL